MTKLTIDTQVSDIVTALPQSADVFRQLRIDYCCGGKIPLKEAAENRQLNVEEVLARLVELKKKTVQRTQLEPAAFGDKTLVAYIQDTYHTSLREEIPQLKPYITKVVRVHGESSPYLFRIQEIFQHLAKELIDHTEDEDQHVFPLILEFLANPTEELKGALKPHLEELENEHDQAGRLLEELRDITNDFTPPENACNTFQLVYARLKQLEKETFEHVHLENNILFDRVRNAMA